MALDRNQSLRGPIPVVRDLHRLGLKKQQLVVHGLKLTLALEKLGQCVVSGVLSCCFSAAVKLLLSGSLRRQSLYSSRS